MCGLPFSGKTTLAKKIAEYTHSELIGFDTLWTQNEKDIPKSRGGVVGWKYIRRLAQEKIHVLLRDNISVIYDDINACKQHREELKNVAQSTNTGAVVIYVKTPFPEILKRKKENLSHRQRHDVEPKNFQKAIEQFQAPTPDEDVLIYDQSIPLEEWIDRHFVPF